MHKVEMRFSMLETFRNDAKIIAEKQKQNKTKTEKNERANKAISFECVRACVYDEYILGDEYALEHEVIMP